MNGKLRLFCKKFHTNRCKFCKISLESFHRMMNSEEMFHIVAPCKICNSCSNFVRKASMTKISIEFCKICDFWKLGRWCIFTVGTPFSYNFLSCILLFFSDESMISKNLKKDFYVKLQAKKVIVLASYEVDSVAACRILITLFKTDSIQYTLVPVFTTDNIEQAYLEHNAHCNDFLFINCGATIDLLELLNPGGMVNLYIIDAHRPIRHCQRWNYFIAKTPGTPFSHAEKLCDKTCKRGKVCE